MGKMFGCRIPAALALAGVLTACVPQQGQETQAILTVLNSLSERFPDTLSTCVSTRYLSDIDSTLSAELQRRIGGDGWHLHDPVVTADSSNRRFLPPDQGSSLIIIDFPLREDDAWVITVSFTETYLEPDTVWWGLNNYTYRVTCEREGCEVIDSWSGAHGDGWMPLEDYLRYDRPRCGAPTPGIGTEEKA
jgi:hypothetical protein